MVVVLKVTPSHLFIPDMAVTSAFACVRLMESWTKIDTVQKTLQFSASLSSPGSTRNRVPIKCFGCKRLWHTLQSEGRGTRVTITYLFHGSPIYCYEMGVQWKTQHFPRGKGEKALANIDTVKCCCACACVHVWVLSKNHHMEIFRQLIAIFTFPLYLSSYLPALPFSSSHLLLRVTLWMAFGGNAEQVGSSQLVGQ